MKQLIISVFIALVMLASSVHAEAAGRNTGISKQQAIEISQQVYPGRVLKVKQDGSVFKVKTLAKDGEVRVIKVDAKSGQVINRN